MQTTFRIYWGFVFLMFLFISLVIYDGYTENSKCEDAGGVYTGHHICINPSAIIEVN